MERPIKCLYWIFKPPSSFPSEIYTMDDFISFTMYLNGNKRFQERNSDYFTKI